MPLLAQRAPAASFLLPLLLLPLPWLHLCNGLWKQPLPRHCCCCCCLPCKGEPTLMYPLSMTGLLLRLHVQVHTTECLQLRGGQHIDTAGVCWPAGVV